MQVYVCFEYVCMCGVHLVGHKVALVSSDTCLALTGCHSCCEEGAFRGWLKLITRLLKEVALFVF